MLSKTLCFCGRICITDDRKLSVHDVSLKNLEKMSKEYGCEIKSGTTAKWINFGNITFYSRNIVRK